MFYDEEELYGRVAAPIEEELAEIVSTSNRLDTLLTKAQRLNKKVDSTNYRLGKILAQIKEDGTWKQRFKTWENLVQHLQLKNEDYARRCECAYRVKCILEEAGVEPLPLCDHIRLLATATRSKDERLVSDTRTHNAHAPIAGDVALEQV